MLALALVVGMASQAALADPTEMPYMEVQYTQLGDGNWEYIYDVYGNGGSWFTGMDMSGFDGTEIINQFGPVTYGGHTGTLVQKWDINAVYPPTWNRYVFGSYSDDGATWTLLTPGDHVEPAGLDPSEWTLDNTWHLPSEYVGGGGFGGIAPGMFYPGVVSDTGLSFASKVMTGGLLNGLIFTFRIVHPNAPEADAVTFHSYSYNNGGQHVYQDLAGPGTGPDPDIDGDGDVDADDIDLLCANMGGDPGLYDFDGDGDVDEDDFIFHVTNYAEWDDGLGGTGTGTLQADFNLDGVVNATDLQLMKNSFGLSGIGFAAGNANCDTVVNATDLQILKDVFGQSATGVPEPLTLGLLAVGGAALLRRRK